MAFYEPVSVFLATLTLWAYSQYTSKASNAFQPHQTSKSKQNLPNIEAHSDGQIDSPPADVDGEVGSPDSYGNHTRSKSPAMSDAGMDISFIHLDRPCDDEMVQYFVRAGKPTRITAYITGVGDICAVDAPIKILQEGQKILGRVSSAWGRTSDYVEMLEALETCS